MVFKVNLGACLVYMLGTVVIALFGPMALTAFRPSDLAVFLFFWSTVLLWAGGAWAARTREASSVVWLLASILLMGAELFAIYLDVEKTREEAITHEYTQSILSFLVVLGQWAVGLPLLLLLAVIWRINRIANHEE